MFNNVAPDAVIGLILNKPLRLRIYVELNCNGNGDAGNVASIKRKAS